METRFIKAIAQLELEMEQERIAQDALKNEYRKYQARVLIGKMSFEEWKDALLTRFVVKAILADQQKGAGI